MIQPPTDVVWHGGAHTAFPAAGTGLIGQKMAGRQAAAAVLCFLRSRRRPVPLSLAPCVFDKWARWSHGSHMSVSSVADSGVQPGVSSKMVGCVILDFEFQVHVKSSKNSYLMIEKSKNSNWGLFGNLEKRSMQ
jgi:hypothetical protein